MNLLSDQVKLFIKAINQLCKEKIYPIKITSKEDYKKPTSKFYTSLRARIAPSNELFKALNSLIKVGNTYGPNAFAFGQKTKSGYLSSADDISWIVLWIDCNNYDTPTLLTIHLKYNNLIYSFDVKGTTEHGIKGMTAFRYWLNALPNDKARAILKKLEKPTEEGLKWAESSKGNCLIFNVTDLDEHIGIYHDRCITDTHIIIRNAFHLDGNSFWAYYAKQGTPEIAPIIDSIINNYDHKKAKEINNKALGFCQSDFLQSYGFNPKGLSKIRALAVNRCTMELCRMTKILNKAGYVVLGYNTDGIWAIADEYNNQPIYQGPEIGDGMGKFKIDYFGGSLYLFNGGWMYENGYTDKGKNDFAKSMRGNWEYNKIKPFDDWTKKDCIKALEGLSYTQLRIDRQTHLFTYNIVDANITTIRFRDRTSEYRKQERGIKIK